MTRKKKRKIIKDKKAEMRAILQDKSNFLQKTRRLHSIPKIKKNESIVSE